MATYYVDKDTGNNGNPGSQAQPWETIEYAMELAGLVAGDIVRVVKAATDYSEDFTLVAGDYSANPITLRPDDYADPPTIDKGTFAFDGAHGYILSGFIFEGCTAWAVSVGWNNPSNNIVIERCTLKHFDNTPIYLYQGSGITIDQCHFRDIRKRVAGSDQNAVVVDDLAVVSDVTISNCFFEDIGSDGIHVLEGADVDGLTIEDCVFGINRPYSAVGTSWYNGDTTTWHDFSTNVGENSMDIKGGGTLVDIVIRRCLWFGFQTTVAGQDCSGASGEGIQIHDSAHNVTVEDCVGYGNDRGVMISGSTGTCDDIVLNRVFLHDNDNYGINQRNTLRSVVTNCQIVSCAINLRLGDNVGISDISGNLFIDGTTSRGNGNTGESNVDYNLWKSCSPPSQWAGSNDYVEDTAIVTKNDTLAGIIELVHQFAEMAFTDRQLQYHPGLSDLYAAIALAMMSGTTTTITQESVSPQRFSVLLEQ